MTPYEMMLSESQERMLLVAERGREQRSLRRVRTSGASTPWKSGASPKTACCACCITDESPRKFPRTPLAEEGPVYQRPIGGAVLPVHERTPCRIRRARARTSPKISADCWRRPRSRRSTGSGSSTITWCARTRCDGPGAGDAAVVRAEGHEARAGAVDATATAAGAASIRVVGAHARRGRGRAQRGVLGREALGRDELPEFRQSGKTGSDVAVQPRRSTASPKRARALEIPITGGNVSFYNETLGKLDRSHAGARRSGIAGRRFDARWAWLSQRRRCDRAARRAEMPREHTCRCRGSDRLAGLREFSSSEYARTIHGIVAGAPPAIDLAAEKRLIDALVALAGEGALQSAHDVSDGGLAVTLAESCFASDGLSARMSRSTQPTEAGRELALFGERGARAVVSVTPENRLPRAPHCGTI